MKNWQWILAFGALVSIASAGQSAKAKKGERKIASVQKRYDDSRVSGKGLRRRSDTVFKLSLNSGYSRLTSNSAKVQSGREKNGTNEGLSLGLTAHLDFMKYGYADAEGYYAGNLSGKAFSDLDQVTGQTTTGTQQVQSYGVLAEAGTRIPLGRGNVRWTPTLGVGVGYLTVRDEKDTQTESENEEHSAFGPYVSGGLGVSIGPRFSLSGDVALSVFAKQQGEEIEGATVVAGGDTDSARFVRVRAGAYYRVSEPVTIGLQYFQRTLFTGSDGEEFQSKDTTKQFLGSLQWNF